MASDALLNPRTRRALEFDRIVEQLAGGTRTPMGAEETRALTPSADTAVVGRWQQETREARAALAAAGAPPLGVSADLRPVLAAAAKGVTMTVADLMQAATLLRAVRETRHYLTGLAGADALARYASGLHECRRLAQSLDEALDPEGAVRDTASPALAQARADIRALDTQLHTAMERLLRRPSLRSALREPLATIRDGRFCLPVVAERQGQVRGIVHDTSASGATVFIEPESVVPLGNALRAAHRREEEEVQRLLRRLTAEVGAHAADLTETVATLGRLDAVFARARLADDQQATEPTLTSGGRIDLRAARHPLLTGAVVPIDFRLGDPHTTMVITGPNTGGKTVALKTVGLLTLMAQCGLQVPAAAGSEVAVFRQVWADIGDEQSVEQSLSTFSSHLQQIIAVLGGLEPPALVLIDEIGAGTAPGEGAALARSLLLHLQQEGVRMVVTSHFDALKALAASHPAMVNASVEFDPDTLAPRYRLHIGQPGGSHAFTVARWLGLPEPIIETALQHLTTSEQEMEILLSELAAAGQALAAERHAAQQAARAADERLQAAAAEAADQAARRQAHLARARDEARALVEDAYRQVREWLAEAEAVRRSPRPRPDFRRAAAKLRGLERELAAEPEAERPPTPAPATPPPLTEALLPGTPVRLRSVGQTGRVLAGPNDAGEVEVQVGVLRVRTQASDLLLVREAGAWGVVSTAATVPAELHLRGLPEAEAEYQLGRYLDQATAAGLRQCRIVHGRGTGALRRMVRAVAAAHPAVTAALGAPGHEGGDGATILELGGEK